MVVARARGAPRASAHLMHVAGLREVRGLLHACAGAQQRARAHGSRGLVAGGQGGQYRADLEIRGSPLADTTRILK